MSSVVAAPDWRRHCYQQRHKTLSQRFAEKLSEPTESGCVLWLGCHDRGGYGFIRIDGKNIKAHRLALEWKLGRSLDSTEQALHSCDMPACVNADHLRVGTTADNQQDAAKRGRCRSQKLNVADVMAIRAMRANGSTLPVIARSFGINDAYVSMICNRKKWRHVA